MRGQAGFFDVDDRLKRLSDLGDQLEAFGSVVDFEIFRSDPLAALAYSDGAQGGRPAAIAFNTSTLTRRGQLYALFLRTRRLMGNILALLISVSRYVLIFYFEIFYCLNAKIDEI